MDASYYAASRHAPGVTTITGSVRERYVALPSGGGVLIEGPADGPPLLFLHGIAGGAWSWEPQRVALRDAFRLYTWEARGHGRGRRVTDAGLGDYYVDAGEALDLCRASGDPPTIVAHSMGGLLAFALTAQRPSDVASLFLVDPVYADGPNAHGPPAARRLARTLCAPLTAAIRRDDRFGRGVAQLMFRAAFRDPARRAAAWESQRLQHPIEYPRVLDEAFAGPERFPLYDFTAGFALAVTLVDIDPRQPRFPALVATLHRRLGDRFRHRTIVAGHYAQLDAPDAVTAALRDHLAGGCVGGS